MFYSQTGHHNAPISLSLLNTHNGLILPNKTVRWLQNYHSKIKSTGPFIHKEEKYVHNTLEESNNNIKE